MAVTTLFAGTDFNGTELWATDGTLAGNHLLVNIHPGGLGSNPADFTRVGANQILFTADDGAHGIELWVSDGTAGGTHLVRDIRNDSSSSFPSGLTPMPDGRVLFAANDGIGWAIWISDGTFAGTTKFSPIPGTSGNTLAPPYIDILSGGGATNQSVVTLTGQSYAGLVVSINEGGTSFGTVTADINGTWSKQVTMTTEGSHSFSASVTDADGTGTDLITYIYDITPPNGSITTTGSLTRFTTQAISGTGEAGDIVRLYEGALQVGLGQVGANGIWTATVPLGPDGDHTFSATETDAAGNSTALGSLTYTLDTVVPVVTFNFTFVQNGTLTNQARQTFRGTGLAGTQITVFDTYSNVDMFGVPSTATTTIGTTTVLANGSWSVDADLSMPNVTNTISVTDTSRSGVVGTAAQSQAFRYDTIPPLVSVALMHYADGKTDTNFLYRFDANVPDPNSTGSYFVGYQKFATTASLLVSINNGNHEVPQSFRIYDNGVLGSFISGQVQHSADTDFYDFEVFPAADGLHVYTVEATDLAGNVGTSLSRTPVGSGFDAKVGLVVDRTPPVLTLDPVHGARFNGNAQNIERDTIIHYTGTGEVGRTINIWNLTNLVISFSNPGKVPDATAIVQADGTWSMSSSDATGPKTWRPGRATRPETSTRCRLLPRLIPWSLGSDFPRIPRVPTRYSIAALPANMPLWPLPASSRRCAASLKPAPWCRCWSSTSMPTIRPSTRLPTPPPLPAMAASA